MPIPAHRTIRPDEVRNFGRFGDAVEVPPLTDVQTRSYERFLQLDVPPDKRTPTGLEGVLREIFPVESYDKTLSLQYIKYELGKPRYGPDECRQLRLTYGRPFRVWLRLNKEQPVEEEVYLGDMPIMIGGGEFIINGAERVVVSQLHRSPGVDFVVEVEAGDRKLHASRALSQVFVDAQLGPITVLKEVRDPLILQSLQEDPTTDHESALLRIYQRLRPGNPPQLEKAKELFHEKFFDTNRYRLGKVGRFRINRKFDQDIPESEMTLQSLDYLNAIRYVMNLRAGEGHVDDIDPLGNRRLRTIDELAADELRKGFLKLRRTVQERMSIREQQDMTPRTLINPKSISAAIEYFFGRSELSQVVDQTNPLSQLTHERRLSALGPGGLNRKRAGFEVRDVHISHYGRICPIETPEGTNIGLISSLSIYAEIDEYGFLITPYKKVGHRKLTDEVVKLRADEEGTAVLAPADTPTEGDKI